MTTGSIGSNQKATKQITTFGRTDGGGARRERRTQMLWTSWYRSDSQLPFLFEPLVSSETIGMYPTIGRATIPRPITAVVLPVGGAPGQAAYSAKRSLRRKLSLRMSDPAGLQGRASGPWVTSWVAQPRALQGPGELYDWGLDFPSSTLPHLLTFHLLLGILPSIRRFRVKALLNRANPLY